MRRIRYKDLLDRNSHLSYEDLVALVSDETSLDGSEKIRKHLDSCWHCQAQHQELKQAVVEIVQNLNAYVGDLSSRSRIAKCRLEQDLQRIATDKTRPEPLSQVLGMIESKLPSRFFARQIAIVALCVIAFLAFFPLTSTAPISAAELLQRSKQAEQQMMQTVPDPAIHGMFRVTKRSSGSTSERSMTWEVWEDTVHHRVRNRVADEQVDGSLPAQPGRAQSGYVAGVDASPLLSDLHRVCLTNGIDITHPLSPDGFDTWRQSLAGERDEVYNLRLPDGDPGLGLRTIPTQPPAEGRIVSAELIVRSGDWHPVEQRFKVQSASATQEYDVVETSYQIVDLSSAPSLVFAEVIPPTWTGSGHHRTVAAAAPIPPSQQELDESEISVKFALHQMDEYLRGQIRIAQDPAGAVQIEGVVETDERKEELTKLLQAIPFTAVKLQTSEEALNDLEALPEVNRTAPGAANQPFVQPEAADVKRNQAWVQSKWNQYGKQFQGGDSGNVGEKMMELSNEAIAHTRAASYQAWALRRLAQDYPRQRVEGMSEWSKLLLQMMVQEHARLLGVEISHLNTVVYPVLTSFVEGGSGQKNSPPPALQLPALVMGPAWQQQVEPLFQNVDDINEQVLGVFGNVDLLRGSAEDAVSDLLRQLPRFNVDVQDFEQQVSTEFSGVGESPALNSSLEIVKF
jgi:hypothetical protein